MYVRVISVLALARTELATLRLDLRPRSYVQARSARPWSYAPRRTKYSSLRSLGLASLGQVDASHLATG